MCKASYVIGIEILGDRKVKVLKLSQKAYIENFYRDSIQKIVKPL